MNTRKWLVPVVAILLSACVGVGVALADPGEIALVIRQYFGGQVKPTRSNGSVAQTGDVPTKQADGTIAYAAPSGNVVDTLAATLGAGADGNDVDQTNLGSLTLASGEVVSLNGTRIVTGSGSPEGVTTGAAGAVYLNTAGGTGTTVYYKGSGVGNTGWVAVASGWVNTATSNLDMNGNAITNHNGVIGTGTVSTTGNMECERLTLEDAGWIEADSGPTEIRGGLLSVADTTLGDAAADTLTVTGALSISASVGTTGQVPTSAGSGAAMVWSGVSVGQPGVASGGAVTITNSLTIDSSYYGKVLVVTGTAVTVTLPTAAAGAGPITVVCANAGTTKVQTSAAGQFIFLGASSCATGGYWQSVTQHSTMTFVGSTATQWVQIGWDGTWTKDGP